MHSLCSGLEYIQRHSTVHQRANAGFVSDRPHYVRLHGSSELIVIILMTLNYTRYSTASEGPRYWTLPAIQSGYRVIFQDQMRNLYWPFPIRLMEYLVFGGAAWVNIGMFDQLRRPSPYLFVSHSPELVIVLSY